MAPLNNCPRQPVIVNAANLAHAPSPPFAKASTDLSQNTCVSIGRDPLSTHIPHVSWEVTHALVLHNCANESLCALCT